MKDQTARDVATVVPNPPTRPFSEPWLARLKRGLGSTNGHPTLMDGFSPTAEETRKIVAMRVQIEARCTPTADNAKHLAVVLAKMFAAFPAVAIDAGPASLRSEAYMDALLEIPAWAVAQAVADVIGGKADVDQRFAPTPPQVASLARMKLKPAKEDLADLILLEKATGAWEPSAAERERVSDGFAKLRTELRRDTPEAVKTAMAKSAFEARCAELGIDPNSVPDQPPAMARLANKW